MACKKVEGPARWYCAAALMAALPLVGFECPTNGGSCDEDDDDTLQLSDHSGGVGQDARKFRSAPAPRRREVSSLDKMRSA